MNTTIQKIYIGEDDIALAKLMEVALAKLDFVEVTVFNNGLEIYRKVQDDPPDLIVMDIIMPKLNGLAVSRLLKFQDAYRNIPLLVSSSIIDPDIEAIVKKSGADDFLRKPFTPVDFRDRVLALLRTVSAS